MAYPISATYKPQRQFVERMKQGEAKEAQPFRQSPDPVDFTTPPLREDGGFNVTIISRIK
jgi:hypothetical protein